jgi:hypothetical protein
MSDSTIPPSKHTVSPSSRLFPRGLSVPSTKHKQTTLFLWTTEKPQGKDTSPGRPLFHFYPNPSHVNTSIQSCAAQWGTPGLGSLWTDMLACLSLKCLICKMYKMLRKKLEEGTSLYPQKTQTGTLWREGEGKDRTHAPRWAEPIWEASLDSSLSPSVGTALVTS